MELQNTTEKLTLFSRVEGLKICQPLASNIQDWFGCNTIRNKHNFRAHSNRLEKFITIKLDEIEVPTAGWNRIELENNAAYEKWKKTLPWPLSPALWLVLIRYLCVIEFTVILQITAERVPSFVSSNSTTGFCPLNMDNAKKFLAAFCIQRVCLSKYLLIGLWCLVTAISKLA